MNIHPSNANEVAWTSWLPALGFALARTDGPVLEIGIGHFSTPFLHEYCRGAKRMLWSCESDIEWKDAFSRIYGGTFHYFCRPTKSGAYGEIEHVKHFGVVFIDNSPGGEARAAPFRSFLDHSDYLVVHDYHRENEEAIAPLLAGVNHRVFSTYQPPTLLASKFHMVS